MSVLSSDAAVATGRSRPRVATIAGEIVTSLLTILMGAVGAFTIVLAVATHFGTNGEYTIAGHPVLAVVSGSMSPTIHTGDLIVDDPVTRAETAELRVGQIITFRSVTHTQTITHRIVGIETDETNGIAYVTKGDANSERDIDRVHPADVVGTYRSKISHGGAVLDALHRPLVLILLLASPILWFISAPLLRMAREMDDAGENT